MARDVYIVAVPPSAQVTQLGTDYARGLWVGLPRAAPH